MFYTDALGLPAGLAGLAMSLAIFWDAVTDPVMGYISDNTRFKFGRRHPYMVAGGILMGICYYFIWAVPEVFRDSEQQLFWYLVGINILLRTAVTVFVVPYVALGFEVCTDYQDRSKLQGIKFAASMLANFLGPALAWKFFFADQGNIKGTSVAENFDDMATVFTMVAIGLILLTAVLTRKYMVDSRHIRMPERRGWFGFFKEVWGILSERYPRILFSMVTVYIIGVVIVGAVQMYVYVHFMQLTSDQKVWVHGMGMLSGGMGALIAPLISRWLDKKRAVLVGIGASVVSNIFMWTIFITIQLPVDYSVSVGSWNLPVAVILFTACQGLFWGGNSILQPISYSMIADVSQIHQHQTGVLRDGSYSAMLSLVYKVAIALGILISGHIISGIGYRADLDVQSPIVITRLMQALCIGGGTIPFLAGLILLRYPINKEFMKSITLQDESIQQGIWADGEDPDE